MVKSLLAKSAAILALAVALVAGTIVPANAAVGPAAEVFAMTNQQRVANGLKPLVSDAYLDKAAQRWANHLASTGKFEHSTSSWRASVISPGGWSSSGENIAAGYTTASSVMSGWMGSPGHKANILYGPYTGLGVGYATGGPYGHYWVQVFAFGPPPIAQGSVPSISGTAAVGSTLTATSTGWPTGTKLTWQWQANGVAIAGATSSRYVPTSAYAGKRMSVRVTGSKVGYLPATRTSNQSAILAR